MTVAPPVRIALIGGGEHAFIGAVHRAAFSLDRRFMLVGGAFSADAERSRRSAAALSLSPDRGYPSVDAMLHGERARPDGAQAVAIVTPNDLHHVQLVAAADAGLAVFCEKPLALSLTEALDMAAAVARNRTPFVIAHAYSGYPMVAQARAMVASGLLGTIRRVDATYLQGWLARPIELDGQKQASWRTDPARSGGGASGDIATHAHHLMEHVTGDRLRRVSARLTSVVAGRRNDDDVSLLGEMRSGAVATLSASQIAVGRANGLSISVYGDKAGLEWRQEEPDILWLRPDGAPEQRWIAGADKSYLTDEARGLCRTPSGHPMGFIEAFGNLYRAFADLIEGGSSAVYAPEIAEGLRGMTFLQAVRESADAAGRWTDVEDVER